MGLAADRAESTSDPNLEGWLVGWLLLVLIRKCKIVSKVMEDRHSTSTDIVIYKEWLAWKTTHFLFK